MMCTQDFCVEDGSNRMMDGFYTKYKSDIYIYIYIVGWMRYIGLIFMNALAILVYLVE